jgi:hypothetical protein
VSIKRNDDVSINIKGDNCSRAIGKIIVAVDGKREERFQQWVEESVNLVNACSHTLAQTEQYFLEICDALTIPEDDRRMRNFKLNVIMNFFKEKLECQVPQFSFDMTDDEMEKWHEEENAMMQEARNSPPERFGLNIRGYYLPKNERNTAFYEQTYSESHNLIKNTKHYSRQIEAEDICFFLEETTEYWQCIGSAFNLVNKLILFRGVTQEDIEKRSPRFLGYITAMHEMGYLPGI